jgi:hypothetical protein
LASQQTILIPEEVEIVETAENHDGETTLKKRKAPKEVSEGSTLPSIN